MSFSFDRLVGYPRPNGTFGIRNFIVVMAAADNVNPLARHLARAVPGVVLVPASYGRGQLGRDFEITLDTMAGLAAHPNVAGCLVVSFEPESSARIADRARRRGRNVSTISFIECGGLEGTLERGRDILRDMQAAAQAMQPEPVPLGQLVVGLECGGSDTTSGLFGNPALGLFSDWIIDAGGTAIFSEPVECLGGEDAIMERAASSAAGEAMVAAIHRYRDIALDQGIDLTGVNPTPDNIAGGLTTIEEKSLGAIAKSGTKRIEGLLGYGEAPPAPGLWFMEAPAGAVENLTALAASGTQAIFFVTGGCNPIGHPISPTIKICANPVTVARMGAHIDADLSRGLTGDLSLDEAADQIGSVLEAVCKGEQTAAERLDYLETNVSRFGLSV